MHSFLVNNHTVLDASISIMTKYCDATYDHISKSFPPIVNTNERVTFINKLCVKMNDTYTRRFMIYSYLFQQPSYMTKEQLEEYFVNFIEKDEFEKTLSDLIDLGILQKIKMNTTNNIIPVHPWLWYYNKT